MDPQSHRKLARQAGVDSETAQLGQSLARSRTSHATNDAERQLELEVRRMEAENEIRKLWLERYKARVELYRTHYDIRKPFVESGTKFADLAIRSLLILNGGAALALLAFLGNTLGKSQVVDLAKLGPALQAFGLGAALSVITPASAYIAQLMLLRPTSGTKQDIGNGIRLLAIMFWLSGLFFFLRGIYLASSALLAKT